jgi:hypothetical protein
LKRATTRRRLGIDVFHPKMVRARMRRHLARGGMA